MRAFSSLIVLALCLLGTAPAFGFELSEELLGVPDLPFKVGQIVTPEQLSEHKCRRTENGLAVCAVGQSLTRGFGIMLDGSTNRTRITGVLSFWKCDEPKCPAVVRDTVQKMTKQLETAPESLDGTPIWKDREKRHRDLMVTQLGSDMVSIVLIESHP